MRNVSVYKRKRKGQFIGNHPEENLGCGFCSRKQERIRRVVPSSASTAVAAPGQHKESIRIEELWMDPGRLAHWIVSFREL